MQNNLIHHTVAHLSQENLQSLIATSTGFIDAYDIPVHDDANILLPQNMVLSAMKVGANSHYVEWHEKQLPTYNLCTPEADDVTALVIEGEEENTRFALLCDHMPESLRLRISQVSDINRPVSDTVYQYVEVDGHVYQIPNLANIQKQLFTKK
ncbi:hypothetical protein F4V57_05625 [Acinetobacter qingfengensis]|uniref:Uncharacterized protein n=1 Tax=Acinetobacter qingfengensis TaxID=1262585 RepID=A0A1E7RDC8_9GAMM|nr:hypothetical protein [Acinetobacter qingfengensis]KAA8734436.1 hypothetical protein F4V57_05625 [Acinetobacter qingfengensis]OEY97348.1 hypothetical protein BJI46_10200 [Acinetobacter qingfengensis]